MLNITYLKSKAEEAAAFLTGQDVEDPNHPNHEIYLKRALDRAKDIVQELEEYLEVLPEIEAYYDELFWELWHSELSQENDLSNSDVIDNFIIEEICNRIYRKSEGSIGRWILENPDSLEARTLTWLEGK